MFMIFILVVDCVYYVVQMSTQRSRKGHVVDDQTRTRGGKGRGNIIRGGSIQLEVDRQRRQGTSSHEMTAPPVSRLCRPPRPSRPSSPSGPTFIPTPGYQSSHDPQFSDEPPSHPSEHLSDLHTEHVDPDVAEPERDEEEDIEQMDTEESVRGDPRGEIGKYVHAVPRDKWPRAENGKYFLEYKSSG